MKNILFIEDESALQTALEKTLSEKGFRVIAALDGEIGLQLAEKEQPDLILLDLILPKKDGFEVLRELKANSKTKDIPVVILSNLEEESDIQRTLELGATTYLVKINYTLGEIAEKVREVLS